MFQEVRADHLFVPAGHTYTYRVRITFEHLEDIDQTADLHAKFITKFILEQGKPDVPLLELIENAKTVAPNFASPATTDETAEGLFSMEDDYGKVWTKCKWSRYVVENYPNQWRWNNPNAIRWSGNFWF